MAVCYLLLLFFFQYADHDAKKLASCMQTYYNIDVIMFYLHLETK